LDAWISADAGRLLGQDVVARFGAVLPYLLKIIAAESPLSMQVHPTIEQARSGYAAGSQSQTGAGLRVDPVRGAVRLPIASPGR